MSKENSARAVSSSAGESSLGTRGCRKMKTNFFIVQNKTFGIRTVARCEDGPHFHIYSLSDGKAIPTDVFNHNWDIVADINVDAASISLRKEFAKTT
jgi:hypothetical protein